MRTRSVVTKNKARCIICHAQKKICCGTEIKKDSDGKTRVEDPKCIDCCKHVNIKIGHFRFC